MTNELRRYIINISVFYYRGKEIMKFSCCLIELCFRYAYVRIKI